MTPNATQVFPLVVDCPPTITSASSTSFPAGATSSFSVTTAGTTYPVAALSESGALPAGVTFVDNGNGTATLSGKPGAGTAKSYSIVITAANGVTPNANQTLTLVVGSAPVFTGGGSTCAGKAKQALACTLITTSGSPVPTFTLAGSPPGWVKLTPNGTGGVTVTGTPPTRTTGTISFTVVATNAFGSTNLAYTVTVS